MKTDSHTLYAGWSKNLPTPQTPDTPVTPDTSSDDSAKIDIFAKLSAFFGWIFKLLPKFLEYFIYFITL